MKKLIALLATIALVACLAPGMALAAEVVAALTGR